MQKEYRTLLIGMAIFIAALTALTCAQGCASARQSKMITIGDVEQDARFRIVGSYTQDNDPGRAGSLDAGIPVDGVPVDINAILESQGVGQSLTLDIKRIGGEFSVEIIGTGIQNGRSIEVRSGSDTVLVGEYESRLR